jgi:hypothetical protein
MDQKQRLRTIEALSDALDELYRCENSKNIKQAEVHLEEALLWLRASFIQRLITAPGVE